MILNPCTLYHVTISRLTFNMGLYMWYFRYIVIPEIVHKIIKFYYGYNTNHKTFIVNDVNVALKIEP